jgi:hypothetical protein
MLFNSSVIETAIGLFFLYLLIALISSAVNEALAGLLSRRAKTLREGIKHILDDPVLVGLADRLYREHSIRSAADDPAQGSRPISTKHAPSYIAATDFARALLDILPIADGGSGAQTPAETYVLIRDELASPKYKQSALARMLVSIFQDAGLHPEQVRSLAQNARQLACVRQELGDVIARHAQSGAAPELVQPVLRQLAQVDNLATQAETQLAAAAERVQHDIERYFDDAMERVSGWYKRRTQIILVVIATVVTLVLNADTLAVGTALSGDASLRGHVADAAAVVVADHAGASDATQQANPVASLDLFGDVLTWRTLPADPAAAANKVIGLLITIIAASLGAPFWFDMLDKVINMRLTGKPPDATEPVRASA